MMDKRYHDLEAVDGPSFASWTFASVFCHRGWSLSRVLELDSVTSLASPSTAASFHLFFIAKGITWSLGRT